MRPVAQAPDELELLADVRDDPLGGVGGGGGPYVGDEVEQRGVHLVADRADQRGPAGRDHPQQRLVGEGQQVLQRPPPRATTITSTSGSASRSRTAPLTWVTASGPCTATSRIRNRTAGQRRRAFSTTSRSAAEARPHTSPTVAGRKGSARLRSAAKTPSAASTRRRCSRRASSSPTPTGRMSSTENESDPRPAQKRGRPCTTTLRPRGKRHVQRIEDVAVAGDLQRQVGVGVPQDQKDRRRPRAAGDLRHLPLDPDRAQAPM